MEDKKLDLLEEVVVAADGEPNEDNIGPVDFTIAGVSASDPEHPCRYKVTITARTDEKKLKEVSFEGAIDTNLFDFVGFIQGTPGNPNPSIGTASNVGSTVKWTLVSGNTELPDKTNHTLDLLVDYKPGGNPQTVCPFKAFPDTFYNYQSKGTTIDKGQVKSCELAVAACPANANCCDCLCVETKNVPFAKCEDQKTETVDVKVTPEGKLLFVNLRFPSACPNKDIAVLVVVTEVEGQNEVPIAHRIIKKPKSAERTDCEALPECQKILFAIPPKECTSTACSATDSVCDCACGEARTFKVRTTAHYLDRTPIDICKCCERDTVTE